MTTSQWLLLSVISFLVIFLTIAFFFLRAVGKVLDEAEKEEAKYYDGY